MSRAWQA
jgi:hypothetical protein